MYPSSNVSSNVQPLQHPEHKKVNLICDVMRVAMEHVDPQKWAFSFVGEKNTTEISSKLSAESRAALNISYFASDLLGEPVLHETYIAIPFISWGCCPENHNI